MKKKLHLTLGVLVSLIGVSLLSISTSFAWFFKAAHTAPDENIDGEVGLRNYFYTGTGSSTSPFEIVQPIHLYNFSRLQNLGVFSNKTYFQLGHVFDEGRGYECINGTNPDGTLKYESFLDMGSFCERNTLLPIGGEGAPFVGDFQGHELTIKGLKISGSPEDIGLFGYVALNGVVNQVTLEDVTINSIGFEDADPYDTLFGSDVEDLFNEQGYNSAFHDALLSFKENGKDIVSLKNSAGFNGLPVANINSDDNVYTEGGVTYYNGYFLPTFPSDGTFSYSWRFSTNVLETYTDAGGNECARINLDVLRDSEKFNSGVNAEIDSRVYLIANYNYRGFTYSRVIQTYIAQFFSNSTTYADGGYSMAIFCDYTGENCTNYHHGNNVGFLAGHVDGVLTDCFVYNGTMNLNSGSNAYSKIVSETDTGLIGEVGINVDNHIAGGIGKTVKGDTGIMNFSGIYSIIRNDAQIGDQVYSYHGKEAGTKVSYFSYNPYLKDDTRNNTNGFLDYLRYDDNNEGPNRHYISKFDNKDTVADKYDNGVNIAVTASNKLQVNTVDFLFNRVIEETAAKDRGLGVFKIATGKATQKDYDDSFKRGDHYLDVIGSSKIVNGEPQNRVYFSTAEYNFTAHPLQSDGDWLDSLGLTTTPSSKNAYIETMATIPSYVDSRTFSTTYERDFNYLFEMKLEDSSKTGGFNYFFNTDSPFLQEYLKYKLIDKEGAQVESGTQSFGFMLRDSEGNITDNVSSYMPVGKPTSKFAATSDSGTQYYPSNSIVFRIDNPNGANVGVIAGGGSNVTIYSYDPSSSATTDITPRYSMYNKSSTAVDSHRYFTYQVAAENGNPAGFTSTVAEEVETADETKKDGKLFAHIFNLPQGDYCIGSWTATPANVYMLCVQGQSDGDIGTVEKPSLGGALVNADFLYIDVSDDRKKKAAKFYFASVFNLRSGSLLIDGSCTTASPDGELYTLAITFALDTDHVDEFLAYDTNDSSSYLVNGSRKTTGNYTYKAARGG